MTITLLPSQFNPIFSCHFAPSSLLSSLAELALKVRRRYEPDRVSFT